VLPRHTHAHEHEVFNVLEGTGTSLFVPAGVEHGFENDSAARWLIRATIYQRTYLHRALRRAVEKRLGNAQR
jgi:quercetin dioxygenase-like cupin family protein